MFEKDMIENIEAMKQESIITNVWLVKPSDAYMLFLNSLCDSKQVNNEGVDDDL